MGHDLGLCLLRCCKSNRSSAQAPSRPSLHGTAPFLTQTLHSLTQLHQRELRNALLCQPDSASGLGNRDSDCSGAPRAGGDSTHPCPASLGPSVAVPPRRQGGISLIRASIHHSTKVSETRREVPLEQGTSNQQQRRCYISTCWPPPLGESEAAWLIFLLVWLLEGQTVIN